MALLESKEKKRARWRLAIRTGMNKVSEYIDECRTMALQFRMLAREALEYENQGQCDAFLCKHIHWNDQVNRWGSYLLTLKELEMAGKASTAMAGIVKGMDAISKEIRSGISADQMEKAVQAINLNLEELKDSESQLHTAMKGLNLGTGTPAAASQDVAIPSAMREQVERLRADLLEDVIVDEEVVSDRRKRRDAVDDRIESGMDRIKRLKKSD